MITIIPDREGFLTQWDKNRTVIISGIDDEKVGNTVVHFSSPHDSQNKAHVLKAYVDDDGLVRAEFPNIFLTFPGRVDVNIYTDDHTCAIGVLVVMPHEKPDDYIYEETEALDWRTLEGKIGDLAKLATAAKENLVAAINEAAQSGGGTASVYMRVAAGFIEYSGDGMTWEKLIAVDQLKGEKGDKGDPGAKGDSGVYVGTGDMPEDCNVQIDPEGSAIDVYSKSEIDALIGTITDKTTSVENLWENNITWQLRNYQRCGKLCFFSLQIYVTKSISSNYGFNLIKLPYAPTMRIWISNEIKFYLDGGCQYIKVNNNTLNAGNYMLSGIYLTNSAE